MHTAKEIVHAEIGHQNGKESQYHIEVVVAGTAQPGDALLVNGYGIDHESDERPGLFGVPTPVCAPRHVGPDGTDEDAESHAGEGGIEEELAHQK